MASSGRLSLRSILFLCVLHSKYPFTSTDTCNILEINSIECDSAIQKLLCERHYQLVYHFKNTSKIDPVFYQVCRVKHKHEHATFTREKFVPCPIPTFVESFLRDTIGFQAHINEADLLYFWCYKYFKSLMHFQMMMY